MRPHVRLSATSRIKSCKRSEKVVLGKAIVLGALAARLAWAPTGEPDRFGERLIRFIAGLDVFAREYFGCPAEGEFEAGECRQVYGQIDYKGWRKLMEQAKEIWKLEEREKCKQ